MADLVSPDPAKLISNEGLIDILTLDIDDIVDLALVFSKVIDFKAAFASHPPAWPKRLRGSLSLSVFRLTSVK